MMVVVVKVGSFLFKKIKVVLTDFSVKKIETNQERDYILIQGRSKEVSYLCLKNKLQDKGLLQLKIDWSNVKDRTKIMELVDKINSSLHLLYCEQKKRSQKKGKRKNKREEVSLKRIKVVMKKEVKGDFLEVEWTIFSEG